MGGPKHAEGTAEAEPAAEETVEAVELAEVRDGELVTETDEVLIVDTDTPVSPAEPTTVVVVEDNTGDAVPEHTHAPGEVHDH